MLTTDGGDLPSPAILLNAAQREELTALIDRQNAADRRHPRFDYRGTSGVVLVLQRSDGRRLRYQVEPVDVSAAGIGILHNGFVRPDSTCAIVLRTVDAELFEVLGEVVKCECLRAPVHFVGIRFRQSINLELFLVSARRGEPAKAGDPSTTRQREAVSSLAMELHCLAQTNCSEEDLRARCIQLCRLVQVTVAGDPPDA